MAAIAVIIVTHDSEKVLVPCMESLARYGGDCTVCIVDSGSSDTSYLREYEAHPHLRVVYQGDIGFGRANNVGYQHIDSGAEYIVFLNPDAFITEHTFSEAVKALSSDADAVCLGGRLQGYDLETMRPTGKLDSTGIFRKWYGRWFDRGQGEPDTGQYGHPERLPAACGAFLFCRKEKLEQLSLADGQVFDPDFFLYKEDIELGLRVAASRWHTLYAPGVKVYHCRGWQHRQQMSHRFRLMAAENEILLYRKHPSAYLAWAWLKYILVRLFII